MYNQNRRKYNVYEFNSDFDCILLLFCPFDILEIFPIKVFDVIVSRKLCELQIDEPIAYRDDPIVTLNGFKGISLHILTKARIEKLLLLKSHDFIVLKHVNQILECEADARLFFKN